MIYINKQPTRELISYLEQREDYSYYNQDTGHILVSSQKQETQQKKAQYTIDLLNLNSDLAKNEEYLSCIDRAINIYNSLPENYKYVPLSLR